MQLLVHIFEILPKKEYVNCGLIFLATLLGAVVEAFGVGLILPFISLIGNPEYLYRYPIIVEKFSFLKELNYKELVIIATTFFLIIYILKNIYLAWSFRFQIHFSVRNQIFYSKELMRVYLYKPYIFHVNHNSASLIRNMTTSGKIVFNSMLIFAFQLLSEGLTVISIWFLLVFIDVATAVSVAIVLAIVVLAIMKISREKIAEQGIMVNQYSVQSIKWINQALGAVKETKLLNKEEFFIKNFDDAYRKTTKAEGDFSFINQLPRLVIETVVVSALLSLVIVKILLGYAMSDIMALLSVLGVAAFRLMPSANRIVGYVNSLKLQMPFFNELYPDFLQIRDRMDKPEVFAVENSIKDVKKMGFNQTIEIRNLTYSYPDVKSSILQDLSFVIPKGAFVGITGSSGAGKTTFVDVFLGLLSPTKGRILVDGTDTRANIRGWQELLAYVPQDISLLDGTIMENIALGCSQIDIDEKKVNQILQMVDLTGFISGLPEGIYTNIGERGIKLSGGQKQRIGLARALYQEPEILVLDEATSALDNETEKNIMDTILKLKGKITILSIAHRVSTLSECDFKVKFVGGTATVH